jgi:hypothetical protein
MGGRYRELQPSPRQMVEPASIHHDDACSIQPDGQLGTPESRPRLIVCAICSPRALSRCRRPCVACREPVASTKPIYDIRDKDRSTLKLVVKEDAFGT